MVCKSRVDKSPQSPRTQLLALFFDINQVTSLCAEYSLTFAHNILVLPGLKTVRVNEHLKNQASVDSSTSFQERHVKIKREFIEHEPSSNTAVLQANIDAFKKTITTAKLSKTKSLD
ncbi:hypothetical protein RMCBS344292_04063 [Rhizopus microsporus]|nr:hypothetical protein RMCBS344292_04063 [Rhizopus microsporus]